VNRPVSIARDFEALPVGDDGSWTHAWYPPAEPPEGPQQEIEERKLVSTRSVLALLPTIYEPIMARILVEAGVDLGA